MQALSNWTRAGGVLGELVEDARERAATLAGRSAALHEAASSAPRRPGFRAALLRPDVAVIAEVKRRSPSRGDINASLSPPERAAQYAAAGAAALSILTQPSRFGGCMRDLEEVALAVERPLLRKDFIVSPLQVAEARIAGASAILLIARALSPAELPELAAAAVEYGLETLVEVRDERELERAISVGADLVGVNNRNLETLEIDAAVSERLIPLIPADRPAIYESGIAGRAGVEHAALCGADAVLVGSALSAAADAHAAVGALVGVPRRRRAGG